MEYQKIVNLLNNELDQPSIFRTRNWIEINDKSRGNYAMVTLNLRLQC